MAPLAIAMALAQYAPGLIKLLTGNSKAAQVADTVVEIAKTVTGAPSGEQALEVIQADPDKRMEFELKMADRQQSLEQMYLTDVQDARARDVAIVQSGQVNHRANAMAGAAALFVLICLGVVVWSSQIDEFAKATITLICGRALGWVEQIFNFEYGTTRSSKVKDDTINNLTK